MQQANKHWIIYTQKYDRNKKQEICCDCDTKLQQNQPKFIHDTYGYSCGRVVCLCCCMLKLQLYQKNNIRIFFKCSANSDRNIHQKLSQMLQSVCIICGTNCRSKKIQFNLQKTYFLVSLECYQKINQKGFFNNIKNWAAKTYYESRIFSEIGKRSKSNCNSCSDKTVDIMDIQIKLNKFINSNQPQIISKDGAKLKKYHQQLEQKKNRIQSKICQLCFKNSKKNQDKLENIGYKTCCECKQIEVIQELGRIFFMNNKKQFQLAYVEADWPLGKSRLKVFKCTYCIYKDYKKMQSINSRIKMDKKQYYEKKIQYQHFFSKHCMVCYNSPEDNANNYSINSSQYYVEICCFMCKRCYQAHSQANLKSRQNNEKPQWIQYKNSDQIKKFLIRTNQNKLGLHNLITKSTMTKKSQKNIRIYNSIMKSKPIEQMDHHFDQPEQDIPYSDAKGSMINEMDKESDHNISQIDRSQFDNQMSQNVLKQFDSLKQKKYSKSSIQNVPDQDQRIGNLKQNYLNLAGDNLIEQVKLKDFKNIHKKKQPNQAKNFDTSLWERRVIEEFKNILEIEEEKFTIPSKPYKLPSQQKWAPRSINHEPIYPKERCLMYNQCKVQQQHLKIQLLCDICFVKYLLGHEPIVKSVQRELSSKKKKDQSRYQTITY